MSQSSRLLLWWIAACCFAAANFFLHQNDNPLGYDEGDYYEAVQRGFWMNWTDMDNMSLGDFVSTGIRAVQGKASKAELSRFARENNSTMFLRHQHPPLAYYPAALLHPLLQHLGLPLHEQLRLTNLFWLLLWCTLLWRLMALHPPAWSPWTMLLPASASYAMAVVGYNMHITFGVMVAMFFYCWFLYEQSPATKGLKIAALFFLAASLVSVAYGLFLLFFLCVWVGIQFLRSSNKKQFLLQQVRNAGWLVLFLLILWPASVLSLSLPRSYIFQMYIALFRLPAQVSAFSSFWEMLMWKWNASIVELAIGAGLLVMVVYHWKTFWRYGSIAVSVGFIAAAIYLQTNPVLVLRWYLFPVFAIVFSVYIPVLFSAGILPQRWKTSLVAAAGTSALFFAIAFFAVHNPPNEQIVHIHTFLRERTGNTVVAPLSIYAQVQAYYPEKTFVRLHDTEFATDALADSVRTWRTRAAVLIPRSAATTLSIPPTDSTEQYLLFEQQR